MAQSTVKINHPGRAGRWRTQCSGLWPGGGRRRGQAVPRATLQASLETKPIVEARPERFRPTDLPGHTMPDSSAEIIIPLNMTGVDCTANGAVRNVVFKELDNSFGHF